MKKSLALVGASLTMLVPVVASGTAHADKYDNPKTFDQAMVGYAMKTHGFSEKQAKSYLQDQTQQQQDLLALQKQGVKTDGAYFDANNKLVVVVANDSAAKAVTGKGLHAHKGVGQSQLTSRADKVSAAFRGKAYVAAVGSDLAKGAVTVTVTKDAPAGTVDKIKQLAPEAIVTTGEQLEPQDDVLGGQDMNMPHGDGWMSTCSNGFMATLSNGNTVMLTAGHCVENTQYPVQDAAGSHVGTIVSTRFHTGYAGRDMGLVDIDSDDTPYGYVDTRGADGYYPVYGMSKNAIGTQLCKSGRTTGWTCGQVQSYDNTVNYGNGTTVSNLTKTSVCTQPGDSGGAYIGEGNLAQGMTSGGPNGQNCGGFNTGFASSGTSYVQPVVDAANYYGATVMTGN